MKCLLDKFSTRWHIIHFNLEDPDVTCFTLDFQSALIPVPALSYGVPCVLLYWMSLLLPKAFSCLFLADVWPYSLTPCSPWYVAGIHLPENEVWNEIRPPADIINQYFDKLISYLGAVIQTLLVFWLEYTGFCAMTLLTTSVTWSSLSRISVDFGCNGTDLR